MKGRVIIKFRDGHLESFRCKTEGRAKEIFERRPDAREWTFYSDAVCIPRPVKKKKPKPELTLEQMEEMIKRI